jgi:hypothetical protein
MTNFKQTTAFDHDATLSTSAHSEGDGLFPLPKGDRAFMAEPETCRHPHHNPPSHLHVPEGHGYRHTCPGCGGVRIITNDGPTFRG